MSGHLFDTPAHFVAKLRHISAVFHTVTISPHFVVFRSSRKYGVGSRDLIAPIFPLLISVLATFTYTILEYQWVGGQSPAVFREKSPNFVSAPARNAPIMRKPGRVCATARFGYYGSAAMAPRVILPVAFKPQAPWKHAEPRSGQATTCARVCR